MCHRPAVPRPGEASQACERRRHLYRSCELDLEASAADRYKNGVASPTRTPFFGALPERGVWTAVGLTRGQFFAILGLSVALFVFVGGPVWAHLRGGHLARIAMSYGVIPPAVAFALRHNGSARLPLILGASVVIALVKLLLTAMLLVVVALAG